ncbi:MAG TPA: sugar transferase [Terracidiphilus sp.]|nr:sugar transferase [Terracidiphilus sp.]
MSLAVFMQKKRTPIVPVASSAAVHLHAVRAARTNTPAASRWSTSRAKRAFDVLVAGAVLSVFALPMLVIALCVRLTSRGPAIFVQQRVGRHGRLFSIYKFRSMYCAPRGNAGIGLTGSGDQRVTPLGRWLRRLKLDELPQFYNVLRGDMSLVGPRPKLPQYFAGASMYCRPGITGAATLAFRCEEELLGNMPPSQIEVFYHRAIKPLKARLDSSYMRRATFWSDLRLIGATFAACVVPARTPVSLRKASSVVTVLMPESRDTGLCGEQLETVG